MEIWKDIPGYEGRYQASNLGRIKSLDRIINVKDGRRRKHIGRIKKASIGNHGYPVVNLGLCDVQCVHVLVAKSFMEKTEIKNHVDHLNNDRKDNNLSNLEWVSQRENNFRQFKRLNKKSVRV